MCVGLLYQTVASLYTRVVELCLASEKKRALSLTHIRLGVHLIWWYFFLEGVLLFMKSINQFFWFSKQKSYDVFWS